MLNQLLSPRLCFLGNQIRHEYTVDPGLFGRLPDRRPGRGGHRAPVDRQGQSLARGDLFFAHLGTIPRMPRPGMAVASARNGRASDTLAAALGSGEPVNRGKDPPASLDEEA